MTDILVQCSQCGAGTAVPLGTARTLRYHYNRYTFSESLPMCTECGHTFTYKEYQGAIGAGREYLYRKLQYQVKGNRLVIRQKKGRI